MQTPNDLCWHVCISDPSTPRPVSLYPQQRCSHLCRPSCCQLLLYSNPVKYTLPSQEASKLKAPATLLPITSINRWLCGLKPPQNHPHFLLITPLPMAASKPLLASLLLLLLAVGLVEPRPALQSQMLVSGGTGRSLLATIDCGAACGVRCSKSSRPNLCKRACGTCCARCGCVPPGTYGNYDTCPCYATLTTHGGRRKCP